MDENLLGAVALLVPNEVTASVSSSTLCRPSAALLDSTTSGEAVMVEGQRTVVTRRRRRRHHHEARVVSPPYGFAVEWLGSSQQPLRSIDVQFNTEPIWALDFLSDGSFLVSGGDDKCVRLWNIREILGSVNISSIPMQMETEHGDLGVTCVAVSPNNRSIFRRLSSTTVKRESPFVTCTCIEINCINFFYVFKCQVGPFRRSLFFPWREAV